MQIYTNFNRAMMASVHADVRQLSHVKRPMRAAGVVRLAFGQWHFQGPSTQRGAAGCFDWHGRAEDAYHARSQGWRAWLAAAGLLDGNGDPKAQDPGPPSEDE